MSDATVLKVFFGFDITMATDQPAQDGSGLIPDFSLAMRTKNKKELMELPVTEDILLTYLSATELAIIKLFGEAVKVIFTSVMKRWGRAVRHNLRRPYDKLGVKALDKSKFVDLIMEYAAEYESSYETKFGKVEVCCSCVDSCRSC